MRRIKCIVTIIMTLAVFLVSFTFPDIYGDAVAETDVPSGIAGNNDVGIQPDMLLKFGEWSYYLDDDDVIIAGFNKPNEQHLKVPYTIDGHIVTGIGTNAFQNNHGLKTIQIHSMVTRIANSAFNTGTDIIINAYSGSYVLSYAEANGLNYNNLTNPCGAFYINSWIIDFSGFRDRDYSICKQGIIVSLEIAKILTEGQLVLIPEKGTSDSPYVAHVSELIRDNDRYIVELRDIDGSEFLFNRVSFPQQEMYIDWNNIQILNDDVEVLDDIVSSAKNNFKTKTINFTYNRKSGYKNTFFDALSISTTVSLNVDCNASFDVSRNIFGAYKMENADIFIKTTTSNDTTVSISTSNKETLLPTIPLLNIGLGPSDGRDAGIGLMLTVKAKFTVSGSVRFVTEMVQKDYHIVCNNRKWNAYQTYQKTTDPYIECTGKASFDLPIEVYFGGEADFGDKVKVSLKFGNIVITPSIGATVTTTFRRTNGINCVDLKISLEVKLSVALGIVEVKLIFWNFEKSIWSYDTKQTLYEKAKLHVEVKGSKAYITKDSKCLAVDRNVIYRFDNGTSDYTIRLGVGDHFWIPEIPTKDGLEFAGWVIYFSGTEYDIAMRWVNLAVDTLPYVPIDGNYYIQAIWKTPGSSNPSIDKLDDDFGKDLPVNVPPNSGTWHPEPPKPVEVTNITLNKIDEILHVDGEYKDKLNLYAVVSPANADDTSVTWSSSNPAVATVDQNGVVSAVAQNGDNHETIITCRSNMCPSVSASCKVNVFEPIYVNSITLDKTSAELWANEAENNTLQLNATVDPVNATYSSVHWSSSNGDVAWVDGWGKVTAISAGTATITCQSIKNQDVTATCQVTVHQHVRDLFVTSERNGLLPTETAQMTALCYPTNADNKNVSWTSSDETIASVDNNGLVTAKNYGEATISATAVDGSEVSGNHIISVEHELTLIGDVQNETLYLDGDNSVVIGHAYATQASIRRIIEHGYDMEWSLLNGETESADAYYDVVPTVYTIDGTDYEIPSVVLYSGELHKAGDATFTLQCKAGPYTATVDLSTTVSGEALAKSVTLDPSKFELSMNEIAHIPNEPIATDGGVIPRILSINLTGDIYYRNHAHLSSDDQGLCVWFPESGQYTANVVYQTANITYAVPVTFEVRDENGIMHLPVTSVTLSESYVNMVVGETCQLSAEVLPADAYDRSITWVSENEEIATVSQDGLVTAKERGIVYIHCEANDGSDCYDSCVLNIEPFMALNETSIDKTIYMDGQTQVDIDSCSLTYQSAIRLEEAGITPNWILKRVSGDATEIALNEFVSTADGNVRIEGEEIELLRTNHVGADKYQLICEAGEHSATCDINLTVIESGHLPESIALVTNSYDTTVGEAVAIDTSVVCTPSSSKLPDDVNISLESTRAFWNAMEDGTYFADDICTFAEAGEYTAQLVYSGANYRYSVPFTVQVKDENGNVPVSIQDIVMSKDSLQLFVGESVSLTASVIPEEALSGQLEWSSYDTSIATVSENGTVTGMDVGLTYIVASSSRSDYSAICVVSVEDGLTLENDTLTKTIFVDGTTRTNLDAVYLTEASSKRLNKAPDWKLQRISGNNLTLRGKECESANEEGDTLYGYSINLYSVSAEGQTVYDLICSSGDESDTMRIVVNAVNREGNIPASISLTPTTYEANVGELIVVSPEITCWPTGTQLPTGTRVEFVGNRQFLEALNQEDWFVSQSISTFSFKEAGRYEANCIYRYSNISYTVPVTFNIKDEQGNVPVHGMKMRLNTASLQLVAGEESDLEAIFTPVDVTNSSVTWESSDPNVASVDSNGHVKAMANGSTEIICTPSDTHCSPVTCYVTVEDYLSVETGNTSYTCFLEGEQKNNLSSAWLTEGTRMRLNKDGIKPTWTLNTTGGDSASIIGTPDKDGSRILVKTASLLSAGITEYTIHCQAGDQQWSKDYSVEVVATEVQVPEKVTLATPEISLAVGEIRTIDFTPVCQPVGTSLPMGQDITTVYAGLGGFYDALDRSVYVRNGDNVTVAFTRPGRYLLTKRYFVRNLDYKALCVINVETDIDAGFGLLRATEQDCTVYLNGKSGSVSDILIYDATVYECYGKELEWSVERLSGDNVSLGLVPNEDTATLFVADAEKTGKDVWRVSCAFGGITDFIDISVEVKEARKAIPSSIELSTNRVTGVIGNWLYLPLGVKCTPEGSALPETGDTFWSFKMLGGLAEEVSESMIVNGSLAVNFAESGYYTGTLTYTAGNVSYNLPVYFTIRDEENQINTPDRLKVWLLSDSNTVYPEGETGVSIVTAVLAENLNNYYAGTSPSFASDKGIEWSVTVATGGGLSLSIQPHTANTADILLTSIDGIGDTDYTVSCLVDGKTYTGNGTLHIASDDEERPDVTLKRSRYQVTQGTPSLISRVLYQRSNGSSLQSAGEWDVGNALSAIGYSYETMDDEWKVTFYKQGEYTTSVSTYVGNLRYDLPLTINVVGKGTNEQLRTIKLPTSLTIIEEEAFSGLTIQVVDMRGSRIETIDDFAFKNCTDLVDIYIPDSVTSIASNAFYGCINLTIHCNTGSVADEYAADKGITVNHDM